MYYSFLYCLVDRGKDASLQASAQVSGVPILFSDGSMSAIEIFEHPSMKRLSDTGARRQNLCTRCLQDCSFDWWESVSYHEVVRLMYHSLRPM
jgi:hypothetical protein